MGVPASSLLKSGAQALCYGLTLLEERMIDHPVLWIPSATPMGCWVASASMMLGRTPHVHTVRVASNGGLYATPENMQAFARELGVKMIPGATLTHGGMERLLAHGPVMMCGNMVNGEGHCIVIGGINGDQVHVYDPKPIAGGGAWLSYSALVNYFPLASRFILHL
jgi:hypothetical protein